jgi:hypothetical protein
MLIMNKEQTPEINVDELGFLETVWCEIQEEFSKEKSMEGYKGLKMTDSSVLPNIDYKPFEQLEAFADKEKKSKVQKDEPTEPQM